MYEQCFAGSDEGWGDPLGRRIFDAESLHDLRSVSKTVTSALLGIALGADFDAAVSRPIGSFFPHLNLRPELKAVKLEHVLTMTAGVEWNEETGPYTDPKNDQGAHRRHGVRGRVQRVWRTQRTTICSRDGGSRRRSFQVVAA